MFLNGNSQINRYFLYISAIKYVPVKDYQILCLKGIVASHKWKGQGGPLDQKIFYSIYR